ncbi:hypothetical protein S245_044897, partial [Arachis hypogaea]
RPLWCENYTKPSCSDREYFFLGQLPYLTNAECLIYEGLTVVVLIIHTFFLISYEGSRIYWRKAINAADYNQVFMSLSDGLVKQVFEMDHMRRAMLEKAFNLLDTHSTGYLNKDQCIKLFEELNKYRTLPKITKEEFELIFDELDDSRDVKLNKDDFADICHAIALKFQKENSRPIFGYLVSFLLVLNLVAVIIETT